MSSQGRGRHARPVQQGRSLRRMVLAGVLVLLVAGGATGGWWATHRDASSARGGPASATSSAPAECGPKVRAVTAASFAPVLQRVAATLGHGPGCIDVAVTVADGYGAAAVVAGSKADVWIPDDASWRNLATPVVFGPGGGTTIATSPLYFVMDAPTAAAAPPALRTWAGLAGELARQGPHRLVVTNPVNSGAGMIAGTALTDAVFKTGGPLIAAYDLMRAWQVGRSVSDPGQALTLKPGEVAIVPEYALRSAPSPADTVIAPTDATALLRFTWFPTRSGSADALRVAALAKLRAALTGDEAKQALTQSGLRAGAWPATAAGPAAERLPAVTAAPLPITIEHHMWHVLTTWQPAHRTANILIVVDVSGSMAEPAPGTTTPLISLVRQGIGQVNTLLPNTARLGLWQFGSSLDPPRDYQQLLAPAAMTGRQRAAVTQVTAGLVARRTGTGLYDTVLAAYKYQQAHFQPGMPNEVLLFTDGVNEDDPGSINLAQLRAALAATDPARRVQIGIFAFGRRLPVDALTQALAPVGGQVDPLTTSNEVIAAFVHAVSGGLTH